MNNKIHKDVVGYISFAKQDLYDFDAKSASRAFATPRSWEFVSQLVAAPAKEFVAGQLALQDTWDDGRGNSTTTTKVVLVRSLETGSKWGPDAVVVLEDGSLAIVSVSTLRHLPAVFKSATI